ncbi:Mercuric resistance operon regulatory protein [Polaribacter huanghezhanensis]|uniref:MerR family transcriptional regulator n=1 Tax=Polaribacter huanghezhanensis TaxID=1354726 RepID=UPI002649D695|nr:MerR family transcriptional regulator [Polaribacter huanghezhanensis]WKD85863.1 Mercuric resistance operon regulatory protein [Polaribacter huanghezhanensis]
MLIGELSNKTGLSRDTIRFYEKKGLIAKGKKEHQFNNYKEYSEKTENRLQAVKLIKSFGFTLNEVAELLDMIDVNEATCNNISEKIEEKVNLLDEKIRDLVNIRTSLLGALKSCKSTSCNPLKPEDNCAIIVGK